MKESGHGSKVRLVRESRPFILNGRFPSFQPYITRTARFPSQAQYSLLCDNSAAILCFPKRQKSLHLTEQSGFARFSRVRCKTLELRHPFLCESTKKA